jgi:hypothetical protein
VHQVGQLQCDVVEKLCGRHSICASFRLPLIEKVYPMAIIQSRPYPTISQKPLLFGGYQQSERDGTQDKGFGEKRYSHHRWKIVKMSKPV